MAVRYGKFTGMPKMRTETKCREWQSKGVKTNRDGITADTTCY
jgi:hypothetical protein